jgi:hypothetical protein
MLSFVTTLRFYGSSKWLEQLRLPYDYSHSSEHCQRGRRLERHVDVITSKFGAIMQQSTTTSIGYSQRIIRHCRSHFGHEASRIKVTQARLHTLTMSTPTVNVASRADPLFLHEIHVLHCIVFRFPFFLVSLHREFQICGRGHVRRN